MNANTTEAAARAAQARETVLSACRRYRYTLWREFDFTLPGVLMVVGLNPSTADEQADDMTITKCINFAKRHECGALAMVNLYAWRETDPREMFAQAEPIGADNDAHLIACAARASLIVAAWGMNAKRDRVEQVVALLPWGGLVCFGRTADGSPRHPCYLSYATQLEAFKLL